MKSLPQLRRNGLAVQLFLDDRPFLILGGELGNSTSSEFDALARGFSSCKAIGLNTVLLPVCWDLIEPREGTFDFTLVRNAIDLARSMDLRLIYLWFGTWKNSMSCYAPSWIKRDAARFSRVCRRDGSVEEIISPQCTRARDADARAFAALMRWTREYDADHQTVIMVQVENEVGMIPDARDHSAAASAALSDGVPARLVTLLLKDELDPEVAACWKRAGSRSGGTWAEMFGNGPEGEEIFTAWSLASYVEHVAAEGAREYALPLFTNAALIRPGYVPGQYPSGGPLPHLMKVWRAAAPSLAMICPDIYFPNFMEWCARYDRDGNPLFVPEMAASLRAPANILYAIGRHRAIGCAPFAVEDIAADKADALAGLANLLTGFATEILHAQRDLRLLALSPQIGFDWSVASDADTGDLAGVRFTATFDRPATGGNGSTSTLPTLGTGRWDAPPGTPPGSVMILQEADGAFLVIGRGVRLTFGPADGLGRVGIESVREYRCQPVPTPGRWLNGDQTHQGRHVHLEDGAWSAQRVTLYRY